MAYVGAGDEERTQPSLSSMCRRGCSGWRSGDGCRPKGFSGHSAVCRDVQDCIGVGNAMDVYQSVDGSSSKVCLFEGVL
jgi:hypothetical protein